MEPEKVFISKETIQRLVKDVKEIRKNPLTEHGIYYEHDEDDILKGQALIIGPKNTPYKNGYYIFKFRFTPQYPHEPPKVVFMTNDGVTRFNPNLYRSGKVCISILNTWKGPQWTACQSISSILLSICTCVLTDTPLINEPGIDIYHKDYDKYNEILRYKNYEVAILQMLTNKLIRTRFDKLYEIMKNHFIENYQEIIKMMECDKTPDKTIETTIYKMKIRIHFSEVERKLNDLYGKLK